MQVHDGAGGHWVAQTPEALLNSSPQLAVKPADVVHGRVAHPAGRQFRVLAGHSGDPLRVIIRLG